MVKNLISSLCQGLVKTLWSFYNCHRPDDIKSQLPWHPMSDPVDIKHLGKLGEELNELGKEINRCLIQGIDEINPDTGFTNRYHLELEMADVEANMMLCENHFKLSIDNDRINNKIAKLKKWHQGA